MSYHEFLPLWNKLLRQGLEDDGWPWDWTSRAIPAGKVRAEIIAKSDGIWAAESLTDALNSLAKEISGKPFSAKSLVADGARVKKGTKVAQWEGESSLVLALERPYLNLASYVSGVATQTRVLVDRVTKSKLKKNPRVTLTRKTLPGYRDIGILGVQIGGGVAHRVSLSGGVLIKENHIASAGGISKAIEAAKKIAPHLLKIEIEVTNLKELSEAIASQAEVVMLDNFTPAQVKSALKLVPENIVVEVSGGINEKTIAKYAIEGVDVISVGYLTHSVKSLDLSLLVK